MLLEPAIKLDLLKEVLAVPSHYSDTSPLTNYLLRYAKRHGWKCHTDNFHNVFIEKGNAAVKPLVCAHIDTVHPIQSLLINEHEGRLFATDSTGNQTGIGGDDKAGVFVCLHLLHLMDDIKAAFFTGEEIGAIGARNADAAWFANVGYCVEFDAPGTNIFSYSSGGVQLFKEDGKALKKIERVLTFHGLTTWQHHPGTDVMILKARFPFTCFNVPCGYYNFHTDNEFVYIDEVRIACDAGEDMLTALGCERYPFIAPRIGKCAESKHRIIGHYTGSAPPTVVQA